MTVTKAPSKAAEKRQERDEARSRLREVFPPGAAAYTVVRHASSGGTPRAIQVLAVTESGDIWDASYLVARAIGSRLHPRYSGVESRGGGGMNMAYAMVYGLGCALYSDGFNCIGEGCLANDHANDYSEFSSKWNSEHQPGRGRTGLEGKRDAWMNAESDRYSPERLHKDGGYALNHRSL
jgi:hypothetical protein